MPLNVLRWAVILTLLIGYPLLAHYTNNSGDHAHLGAVVALAPLILMAGILAWNTKRRLLSMVVFSLICMALWSVWPLLEQHYGFVYWLQYLGMQVVLFLTFARTLIAGRKPLCTRLAEIVHPPLTPQHEVYTRHVTVAWALFFAAMACVSTLLFFMATLSTYSVFTNLLTLPLVVLMFVLEYWVRHTQCPDIRKTNILDAVRAFRTTLASPANR